MNGEEKSAEGSSGELGSKCHIARLDPIMTITLIARALTILGGIAQFAVVVLPFFIINSDGAFLNFNSQSAGWQYVPVLAIASQWSGYTEQQLLVLFLAVLTVTLILPISYLASGCVLYSCMRSNRTITIQFSRDGFNELLSKEVFLPSFNLIGAACATTRNLFASKSMQKTLPIKQAFLQLWLLPDTRNSRRTELLVLLTAFLAFLFFLDARFSKFAFVSVIAAVGAVHIAFEMAGELFIKHFEETM